MFPLRQTIDLTGAWSFAVDFNSGDLRTIADVGASRRKILPGQVPGNLELDLHAAGEIPEPFHGMNIAALRKYESAHAWYFRRFDCTVPADTTPVLVFEGLDCFADICLNGRLIGSSANALVEHVFPAEGLRPTGNELLVHLRPVAEEARKFDYPPGSIAQLPSCDSLHVRKPPHAYGWDIMPRATGAGSNRRIPGPRPPHGRPSPPGAERCAPRDVYRRSAPRGQAEILTHAPPASGGRAPGFPARRPARQGAARARRRRRAVTRKTVASHHQEPASGAVGFLDPAPKTVERAA